MPAADFEIPSDLAERFHRDGFAVIDNFITPEEIEELKQASINFLDSVDPDDVPKVSISLFDPVRDDYQLTATDKMRVFFEPAAIDAKSNRLLVPFKNGVNKLGHGLHCVDPTFKKYSHAEKLRKVAETLGFDIEPRVVQSMFLYRPPKVGKPVGVHRDETFLPVEYNDDIPNDERRSAVLGFWTPLQDTTPENGCLWFVPGSHKDKGCPRLYERYEQDGKVLTKMVGHDEEVPADAWVPVPVKAGGITLLDGRVLHKGERNETSKPREAYIFQIVDFKEGGVQWSPRIWLQMPEGKEFPRMGNPDDE